MSPSAFNIACASTACPNPVVGQCAGYKTTCGKFYCATHSSGSLCAECSVRKSADEKAEQFRISAEQVEREHISFTWKSNELRMIGLAFGLFPVTCLLWAVAVLVLEGIPKVLPSVDRTMLASDFGILFGLGFLSLGLGAGLALIVLFVNQVRYDRELSANRKMRVMQIASQEPGFEPYYANWKITKQQKSIEQAVTVAAIALAVIGGAVAETEEQRMRRVMDEELRRHRL